MKFSMRLFRRGEIYYYSVKRGHMKSLQTSDYSEAQRLYRKIKEAFIEGKLIKISKTITLDEAIQQFLRSRETKKKRTYETDWTCLKPFLEFFGNMDISRMTLQRLQEWLSWLKETKGLRDTTLNIRIRHVKVFLRTMQEWGYLQTEPWKGWKQLRAISQEKYILSKVVHFNFNKK